MLEINFTKMHGLKNSFVILEDFSNYLTNTFHMDALAKTMTSKEEGIGADGLVLLKLPVNGGEVYDLKMVIFNRDGSEAKMCGNAIRCLAKYAYEKEVIKKKKLIFKTKSGFIKTSLMQNKGVMAMVKVDMGRPTIIRSLTIKECKYFLVSMGNLHVIRLVENFDFDYQQEALALQKNGVHFPENINVEFVKISPEGNEIFLRVIEAGVGETPACGTGACASAALAIQEGWVKRNRVTVKVLGGTLDIIWSNRENIFMTGEASKIGEGVFFLEEKPFLK